ncbi:MAG: class I SAM-dependent methyltransferase [Candidatus Paceibacterota bacterium]
MDYRDKIYSKYISTHSVNLYGPQNLDNLKKQFIVWQSYFGKFISKDKSANIADIGCGNGGFVYWLQQLGYKNAVGIDVSEEQISVAKKLGINNVFQGDAGEFLNDKNGQFDLLFMRDFIEHLKKEEILKILELAHKSLKDGGLIVIQTVNAESPFFGRIAFGDLSHETFFTKESMNQLLSILKFKQVEIFGTYPVVHGPFSFIVLYWEKLQMRF